jgi:hypothetical protein
MRRILTLLLEEAVVLVRGRSISQAVTTDSPDSPDSPGVEAEARAIPVEAVEDIKFSG